MNTVVKRDGRKARFDKDKIVRAIEKALRAANIKDVGRAVELAEQVEAKFAHGVIPAVEVIQDTVEAVLVENGLVLTAKEFILYRAERTRIRERNTRLMQTLQDLTFKSAKDNDIKRENANIDGDTAMGTMLKYGSESAKQFYEMSVLHPLHSQMHKSGDIHIHDLDFFTLTTTCCQIDLDKLFRGGFSTGHGFLREPNHIGSYASLACIAIQSNQNDQHGGQSVPTFDYALAPGVAKTYVKCYRDNMIKALDLLGGVADAEKIVKDTMAKILTEHELVPTLKSDNKYGATEAAELSKIATKAIVAKCQKWTIERATAETERATYQAMEALVHNLNTMHSRAGAQIPFSSINYGTDTTLEGRMIIRNILLATESGLGNSETPIFPIHVFKVKEGVNYNKTDPNYDLFKLAMKVSAKRLFPNFNFLDASFNKQYYKEGRPETECAYMGCRTRVIGNAHDPNNEIVTGRGNLSFTSLNLPRMAIRAKGSNDLFFDLLDRNMEVIVNQLLERFEIQSNKRVRNYPFLMGQGVWIGTDGLGPDDSVGEALKHGTLAVGFIGLAECLKALTGKHHGESVESQNLGLEIVGYMRKKCDEAAKRYKLNFSLIATPAEGLSGRFVKIDKDKFGIIPEVTDREYYTNSFHVPVYYNISAHDKIKLEAPYHALTNGGHITYVEFDGAAVGNLEAFEKIVRFMKESDVGYGSINHPVDRDPVCGYTGIINGTCPKCGRKEADGSEAFERIRRITGYLVGTLDRFNNAKKTETNERVKHNL
ncbi:MAG: anaerobic ribonucleoside triphosphate reductase [Firmicutes bacterium]|nr:anaerobic ribonucleoside triphosphate reductase [Bacillota bacterium]